MSKVHSTLRRAAEPVPAESGRSAIPSVLVRDGGPATGAHAAATPARATDEDLLARACDQIRSKEERLRAGIARLRAALEAAEKARAGLAAENERLQAQLSGQPNA